MVGRISYKENDGGEISERASKNIICKKVRT